MSSFVMISSGLSEPIQTRKLLLSLVVGSPTSSTERAVTVQTPVWGSSRCFMLLMCDQFNV